MVESAASGSPQTGTPGLNGLGTVQQGSLETSNVNTVTELVNMIECQRAYEMNSKAITTSDQMLQYLTTNLSVISMRIPPKVFLLAAVPLCAGAALSGCSTFSHKDKDHKVDPVVPRALPPPVPRTDGAIYQAGQEMALFADLKARRVGDVLTIVLNEATAASKNAETKTSKTSAVTDTGPTIFGKSITDQGRADPRYDALRARMPSTVKGRRHRATASSGA